MDAFYIFCTDCKCRYKTELLQDGLCPTCGKRIGLPDTLNIDTGRKYDIRLTFTDIEGNICIKDYSQVPEAYYNKLRYANSKVHGIEILAEYKKN